MINSLMQFYVFIASSIIFAYVSYTLLSCQMSLTFRTLMDDGITMVAGGSVSYYSMKPSVACATVCRETETTLKYPSCVLGG